MGACMAPADKIIATPYPTEYAAPLEAQDKSKRPVWVVKCITSVEDMQSRVKAAVLDKSRGFMDPRQGVGGVDFVEFMWDKFANGAGTYCYPFVATAKEDAFGVGGEPIKGGEIYGIFFAVEMGHGDTFLNGLRSDPVVRRTGMATAIFFGIDRYFALEESPPAHNVVRYAVLSFNFQMKNLSATKLKINPTLSHICYTQELKAGEMQGVDKAKPEQFDAIFAWLQQSESWKLLDGQMNHKSAQFCGITQAKIKERIEEGKVFLVQEGGAIKGVAVTNTDHGADDTSLNFIDGDTEDHTAKLMDELRCLLKKEKAYLKGYFPDGSKAYKIANQKKPLPSGVVYTDKQSAELVFQWPVGSLHYKETWPGSQKGDANTVQEPYKES